MISRADERAVSYAEAVEIVRDLTENFTERQGVLKVTYEYERRMVVQILKDHYEFVESSYDMKYQKHGTYLVSYSNPKST